MKNATSQKRDSRKNPRYPVYIISKGRWESRLTTRALEKIRVPYRIVIEKQEYAKYAAVIDPAKILVLPFANLRQGGIPARNWVWEHAIAGGHKKHWIMDDNIRCFMRCWKNINIQVEDGTIFRAAEDFTDRYSNIALAGLNYAYFPRSNTKPFSLNTRIYSCILINNATPFRWRGRYNEDTDLSLRALKSGWCTVLFRVFIAGKVATMTMKGGNTDQLYKQNQAFDGRLEMAMSLKRQHPDITTVVKRWGRWQHRVDYKPFAKNKLIRKKGIKIKRGIDEYGMILKRG